MSTGGGVKCRTGTTGRPLCPVLPHRRHTAAALRDRHPGPSLAIVAGPDFRRAAASAVGALLALALGSALGEVRGRPVHLKVIALTAAGAFLLFGALTIKFVASELDRIVFAAAARQRQAQSGCW